MLYAIAMGQIKTLSAKYDGSRLKMWLFKES